MHRHLGPYRSSANYATLRPIMPAQPRKTPTSFRLSLRALRLLEKLALRTGVGRSAYLEMAIRELARREGVG
jgi:hypothetical protein